jgi:uncharacterized membrane protein
MRFSKTTFFLSVLLVMVMIPGCYYDKEDLLYVSMDCSTTSAKFNVDVITIFQTKCNISGCHNTASAAGGIILDTYDKIYPLVARINQRCIVDKTMPASAPLPPAEIAVLNCWILSGAPNN